MNLNYYYFFCDKQEAAYEMRIIDWSSDVCSTDLPGGSVRRWRHGRCWWGSGRRIARHRPLPARHTARQFARIGETRRVDHAQQRRFRRLNGQRGARDLVMPLEQQLPEPVKRREGEFARPFLVTAAFLGGLRGIGRGAELDQRDSVDGFEQRAQHRLWFDAVIKIGRANV